jgi:hypothetical protein
MLAVPKTLLLRHQKPPGQRKILSLQEQVLLLYTTLSV